MMVSKWVEFEKEVEIRIVAEDIAAVFTDEKGVPASYFSRQVNDAYAVMQAVLDCGNPSARFTEKLDKTIADALRRLADGYERRAHATEKTEDRATEGGR